MSNTINPALSSRLVQSMEALADRADSDLDVSDFELLISQEERKSEKDLLKDFALGEHLAHGLAYQFNQRKEGQRLFIHEQDGMLREYTVQKIHSGHGGLVAEIFKPSGENTTSTVYVNFTGTHNAATLHADVEYCPGEKTFQKHKAKLMAQINQVVGEVAAKTNQEVNLVCAGHSLGAAYAQQCVTEVMRYRAHSKTFDQETQQKIEAADKKLSQYLSGYRHIDNKIPNDNHFNSVNAVTLLTWNAAGVSKAIQDYSNQMADILAQQDTMSIQARFGMVGGDGVQLSGEGTVLSDCKADVANLKVDRGLEGRSSLVKSLLSGFAGAGIGALLLGPVGAVLGGTLGALIPAVAGATGTLSAHTAYHFPKEDSADIPNNLRYELLRNNTDEGHAKIKTRLQKKSTILQTPIAHGGMYFLRKMGDLGAYIKQPFQTGGERHQSSKCKAKN